MENAAKRLIIALDDISHEKIAAVIDNTRPFATTYKIGLSLFVAYGPAILQQIKSLGAEIFLDLKLHDIPMQVERAVHNALHFSPRFLTIHAQGGSTMMKEVANVARGSTTKILAVTVLTSLDRASLEEIGYHRTIDETVLRLADCALSSGIDGLVASPHELATLRIKFGAEPYVVCPGVRMHDDAKNDQARIMTPRDAILLGANALVMGRPITQAANPLLKAKAVHQEIDSALKDHYGVR